MFSELKLPAQPEDEDEAYVLGVIDDYFRNGGKIPKDADIPLLMRLNLAASKTTWSQSRRNHQNIVAQWLALGGLFFAGVAQVVSTASAHTAIWAALQVLQGLAHTH